MKLREPHQWAPMGKQKTGAFTALTKVILGYAKNNISVRNAISCGVGMIKSVNCTKNDYDIVFYNITLYSKK